MTPRLSSAMRSALGVLACASSLAAQHGVLPADQKTAPDTQAVKAPEPLPVAPMPDHWQPPVEMPPLPAEAGFAVASKLPDHVLHDERDGALWALGHDYKASFDAGGMTFIPYFGASAPRNFPVRFTVTSIHCGEEALPGASRHAPQREGDRIRIERGPCVEVYDLGLRGVEQSFVFPPMPATGDLCVRLRAQSELTMFASARGLQFRGEHGSVTYEKLVVFDGAGRRQALAIESAGTDQIVLRVPQQFLASATGSITIDPIVATFFPATGSPVDFHPDVTFIPASAATTWQRVWSSVDHDVFLEWRSSGFVFAVDFTSENWQQPRIAANATAGTVLVVAQVGQPWGQRVIKGRSYNQPNGSSLPFQISSGPGEAINCDVGGDPSGLPGTVYCVVWEQATSTNDRNILFRTVAPITGAFGSPFPVPLDAAMGFVNTRPRIAKTCGPVAAGAAQFWPVVWQRTFSPTDEDIRGALIGSTGGVVVPSFSVDFAAASDTNPVVSSPTVPFGASTFSGGRAFLVVYERTMAIGGRDVHARVLSGSLSLTGALNLSALVNPSTAQTLDQFDPSVDCDGMRFAVAHVQRDPFVPAGDNDAFVATWSLAGGLTLREPPRLLNSSTFGQAELNPSIANSPGTTLHAVVFERVTTAPTDRDVFGAFFDTNLGLGSFTTGGCPLSTILLRASTLAPLVPGATRTLTASSPSAVIPMIALGPEVTVVPCVPCTLHVDLTSASVAPGPSLTFTVPADLRLIGARIAAQAFGDCFSCIAGPPGSGCFAFPFTYSNAVVMPIN